jgi:hypothetical protein
VSKHPELAKLKVKKEHYVLAEFVRRLGKELETAEEVIWDCRVPGGCSLKRPDLLYRFKHFYIQVEVDEDGHEETSCADEDSRLAVIQADVDLPGVVIRLNPDLDGFACFRSRQLRNGEKVLEATKHFDVLMAKAEQECTKLLGDPPTELLRVFVDADPAAGVYISRVWGRGDGGETFSGSSKTPSSCGLASIRENSKTAHANSDGSFTAQPPSVSPNWPM